MRSGVDDGKLRAAGTGGIEHSLQPRCMRRDRYGLVSTPEIGDTILNGADLLAPLKGAGCGAQGGKGRSGAEARTDRYLPYSGSAWRARALGGSSQCRKNRLYCLQLAIFGHTAPRLSPLTPRLSPLRIYVMFRQ